MCILGIAPPKNHLSRRGLTVWRITGFLQSLVVWLLAAGGTVLVAINDWQMMWVPAFFTVAAAYTVVFAIIIPPLRWKRWRYEVRELEIELQHGVFFIKRTLIPMVRVQHVDTTQGPLLRRNKLAAVSISTAATVHEIPAVDVDEADELRASISALARVAEDDV